MPKLVIKQDVETADPQVRQSKWLSLGGLLLLLVAVAATAYFFTRPVVTSPFQQTLVLDSARNATIKAEYLSMHKVFNELGREYEELSSRGLDNYEKNIRLLDKSGEILLHLENMSALMDQLGLDDVEYQQLINRHQFNEDYWQARSHFRQLRVSRFETSGKRFDVSGSGGASGSFAQDVAPAGKPKKFQFAKPPAGMKLPEGFCDLTNPGSCKPEATAQETGTTLPLPEDLPAEDVASKPKKFQFAKPPPGMELPEGFCDLSNSRSCQPENEAMIAGDGVGQPN